MLAILVLAPILLEVGGGPGLPMSDNIPLAIVATARAAFEWPVAAAGLRAVALIGPEGRYDWYDNKYGKAGFRGWALLAEVEGHARAPSLQGFVRAGLGIGQIQKIVNDFSFDSLDGSIGPACKLSLGIRVAVLESFWLGVEGGFLWFVKVRHVDSDPRLPRLRPEPLVPAGMVLLTVGMRR
jgi:hypothetical protein